MTTQIDMDARYSVIGYEGIAFYLIGYVIEPPDCQGHPDDGEFDGPIGEAFYCDGSCEEPWVNEQMVRAVMVGDDRVHEIDVDDLTEISEDDYCSGCGQIGCGHG